MTEQKAENPIDDLFRKTFEDLPSTPAESGWDTPSERVWQHVQANIQTPRKGWSVQSFLLLGAFAIVAAAGMYWMFATSTEPISDTPATAPLYQPQSGPTTPETPLMQPGAVETPAKTPEVVSKSKVQAPRSDTDEHLAKPGANTAQPLPGSKPTLPPNTTEAKKKKSEQD